MPSLHRDPLAPATEAPSFCTRPDARLHLIVIAVSAVCMLTVAAVRPAAAQQGEWELGLKAVTIQIDTTSETFTDTGTGLELDNIWTAELHARYMVLSDWSVELGLSAAEVDLRTVGGANGGLRAGTAWITPVTLMLQYHLPVTGRWRPLVGVGVGTGQLWDASASDEIAVLGARSLDLTSRAGPCARLGVEYEQTDRLHVSFDVSYLAFTTEAELRLGNGTLFDTVDVDLKNLTLGVGVGYWF